MAPIDIFGEDWPDAAQTRERRMQRADAELARLIRNVDPLADELVERQRAALQQSNEYHRSRDPRPLAVRLGIHSIDRRHSLEDEADYGKADKHRAGKGGMDTDAGMGQRGDSQRDEGDSWPDDYQSRPDIDDGGH